MQSLLRGLRVMETVAEHQPVGVGELSRVLDLPKSTVQRILRALAQEGWLEPNTDPVTRWVLSPRMLTVARRGSTQVDLREAALPHLRALTEKTGETSLLSMPDGTRAVVVIERVDSQQPVRTFHPIGTGGPLHATASGKALMAAWSAKQADAVLRRKLERLTDSTVVDPKALRQELADTRKRGYALNSAENRAHVFAIAAAVTDADGTPVAAVSVSMPDIRFTPDRLPELGALVVSAAKDIERTRTAGR
ncbi:IclR family transcriptional regulator [Streptomyces sp. BV129]|uniref:IclR family transcriptional regulator n=1 Tax=Streptomyces sp. BV129 TaxID=2849671 RepID=UPI001C2EF9D5|nr:IclR family transcriptional regulator [Streptomyces sp. BV129]MBV1949056.1 IclR family transcriptional regulator [Streptomyces sp. BV129]